MGRRGFPPPSSRLTSSRLASPRFASHCLALHLASSPSLFESGFNDDRENGLGEICGASVALAIPLITNHWTSTAQRDRSRSMRNYSAGSNLSTFRCRSCISQFLSPSATGLHTFNVLRKQIRAMINSVLNQISPIARYGLNRCYSFVVND